MDASGGRTGRGDVLRWCDERELDRDWGRSGSSALLPLLVAESAEDEDSWLGDELRTFDGVLKDSSKGLGSR